MGHPEKRNGLCRPAKGLIGDTARSKLLHHDVTHVCNASQSTLCAVSNRGATIRLNYPFKGGFVDGVLVGSDTKLTKSDILS